MDSRQPSESVTYSSRVQSRPAAANTSSDPVQRQRQGRTNLVSASLNGGSIPFSGASKPTTTSSDSQRKPKKMHARGTPGNKPRDQGQQHQKGPPGAKATTSGVNVSTSATKALPQLQTRKTAARPSTTSTTASPNNSRPATAPPPTAPPPRQNHVVITHKAKEEGILWKALQKHPVEDDHPEDQPKWFDSYNSLDRKLLVEHGKHKDYRTTRLADLGILTAKNGTEHEVGLQHAVRDTISYLLDVEAECNPVTLITKTPQGSSKPLWEGKGKLYLGGIKDSGNVKGVLNALHIHAIVSIHPTDWLTDECWKGLFEKWDLSRDPNSPQFKLTKRKRLQYHIELHDDSSSDLLSYFESAFWFINHFLAQNKNVLVHCKMGQSRSGSLVLGYMMDRYYRTRFEILDPNKRPPSERVSKQLLGALKVFFEDLTSKRKGVSMKKFEGQLEQYAQYLAEGGKNQPSKPLKLADKSAGGGIIKIAAIVLCFMCDIKPTLEILGYWDEQKRKNTNTHYWESASRDKPLKKDEHIKSHWERVNEFFEDHRKLSKVEREISPQKAPPK